MELKDFKEPDLNAPRYRQIVFNPLSLDFYRHLKKQYPHLKQYSNKKIYRVIKLSNEKIADKIIENRDGVELPESLGHIVIGSCKKLKGENPDYNLSRKHKKLILHRNWESDEYISKILYTNHQSKYKFKFHKLWTFKACRAFSRKVSEVYPLNWKKYIHLEPTMHIAMLYRANKKQQHAAQIKNKLLETYNEFAEFQ